MITIRPSIFCFLGRVASDLHGSVPAAIQRRLGTVPDVFAFVWTQGDDVELRLGTHRPKQPGGDAALQTRFWSAITHAAAAIGNIRVRTNALRHPAETDRGFQVVRGGPDIYIVQCLTDPMGWEMAFALAERIHQRNETPPSAGRARGIFPLFHLPSENEDTERTQALRGIQKLEELVSRGVLFPSIVLDRVNRNGYPLERWEDLTELLTDFISLGAASEAAADIWGTFPQVADLHATGRASDGGGSPALSTIGLARFRFNKEILGEELSRFHLRDLKRAISSTTSQDSGLPDLEQCREFLSLVVERRLSERADGTDVARREIVEWIRDGNPNRRPGIGTWVGGLDRLQKTVFESLGETAQRIENARQQDESISMESPLRDTWIARLSVQLPPKFLYLPAIFLGAIAGTFVGLVIARTPLVGYMVGGAFGAVLALGLASLLKRRLTRETFTLGEFPHGSFTESFSVPRTLERFTRQQQSARRRHGVTVQLWGELRNQLDPTVKARVDQAREEIESVIRSARLEETELVFLDRSINALRESVEGWKSAAVQLDVAEARTGFSGDIFPSDGPRQIYEWLNGRESADRVVAELLEEADPTPGKTSLLELAEGVSKSWARSSAEGLHLEQVLEILDDRPEDLVDRLSEASAPLWPRPGDRDELLRCFGDDFAWLSEATDLRSSVKDETVFIRVLGGVRSAELVRT